MGLIDQRKSDFSNLCEENRQKTTGPVISLSKILISQVSCQKQRKTGKIYYAIYIAIALSKNVQIDGFSRQGVNNSCSDSPGQV